jgi:transcriptional regulator with XRE-family HTH domain
MYASTSQHIKLNNREMTSEQDERRVVTLKALRELANYSQKEISQRVGVNYNAYQAWESGRSVPKFDNAVLLARELNVSLKTLAKSMGQDTTELRDDLGRDELEIEDRRSYRLVILELLKKGQLSSEEKTLVKLLDLLMREYEIDPQPTLIESDRVLERSMATHEIRS